MFRRWLSSFIKRNKDVILKIAKHFAIMILIALSASAIMSVLNGVKPTNETENSISIYNPTETIIEGKEVTKEEFNKDEEIIKNFMEYCNNGKIESAYGLISDICKQELFPSVDDFKKNYYLKLFKTKKEYNLQSWINENNYHTYRIRFLDDMLSSGEYDSLDKGQDYITVISSNEGAKINLNGFIGNGQIYKETTADAVKALAVERFVYVDYIDYVVKIKNLTNSDILLDTGKNLGSIKLVDQNGVKYPSYKTQIKNLNSKLSSNIIRTLKIRFNKTYSSSLNDRYIEFSDIVTDIEKYEADSDYKDRESIQIQLQ